MRRKVNPQWIQNRKKEIDDYFSPANTPLPPVTISYNPAAQWYLEYMDSKNLHCKVLQLGAGVKKIIHMENLCPHCGGKGVK